VTLLGICRLRDCQIGTAARLLVFVFHPFRTLASPRRIDNALNLRPALEQEVEQVVNDERKPKRKWRARSKHDTFDLLLDLRMKHDPDTKALKSVWLGALRTAKARTDENGGTNPVKPTEAAFVEWITPIGVVETGKRGKAGTSFDLCSFADTWLWSSGTLRLMNSGVKARGQCPLSTHCGHWAIVLYSRSIRTAS
jgi:hypothetical protein